MTQTIQHVDFLGQPIGIGDYVSFTWSQVRGIRVGIVTKITKKRVRMSFNNFYVRDGIRVYYTGNHIAQHADCLVLGDGLQQQLTLATLQKKI
jgi:hypothetical protein